MYRVNVGNIPLRLRKRRQWLCWKTIQRGGRDVKIPIAPWITGDERPVAVNDPTNIADFKTAYEAAARHGCGIGFATFKGDGVVMVDLDDCVNRDGSLHPVAQEVLEHLMSYAEYSPSGKGIHIIARGSIPRGFKTVVDGVEVAAYEENRFFTFTGDHVPGTPMTVENCSEGLEWLAGKYCGEILGLKTPMLGRVELGEDPENRYGLRLSEIRRRDRKLDLLLREHIPEEYKDKYPSISEADLATMDLLIKWGFNPETAVAIFTKHRWRGKLRRRDYVEGLVKKALQSVEPRPVEPAVERYMEGGRFRAYLLALDLMEEYRFITDEESRIVYVYRDGCYRGNGETLIRALCIDRLGREYSRHRADEVVDAVKSLTYVKPREEPPNLINLENGVLDIEKMELKPHSPEYMFFNKLHVNYDPKAECPKIMRFIREIVDEKDVPLLQETLGLTLYRANPLHYMLVLLGEGANGKTTLINLLRTLLGDENVSSVSLHSLENDRFAAAQLHHKLANTYTDLPAKELRSTGRIKALTGEDCITAQHKYKPPFQFRNYAKQIFSCNRLPPSRDDTDAFHRRMIVINFPNQFTGERADPKLLEKLTTPEELSGLLNWLLEGLKRALENGRFSENMGLEEKRQQYTRLTNPIKAFAEEMLEQDPESAIPKIEVYREFIRYCQRLNLPTKSQVSFSRELPRYMPNIVEDRVKVGGRRLRAWRGLRIRAEGETLDTAGEGVTGLTGFSNKFPSTCSTPPSKFFKKNGKSGQTGHSGERPAVNWQQVHDYLLKHGGCSGTLITAIDHGLTLDGLRMVIAESRGELVFTNEFVYTREAYTRIKKGGDG